MNQRLLITTFVIMLVLLFISVLLKVIAVDENDTIIKQNDEEILVRKYKTHISLSKNLKSFDCKIDSSLWTYPPNKILCDGIIVKAKHDPHEVILKITITKNEKGKIYKITTTKNVAEYFSCTQVDELATKIGKRMIITEVHYPRKRIYYKFP